MKTIIKIIVLSALLFTCNILLGQTSWQSSSYNYSIEIPKGFETKDIIGANVDFKAFDGFASIVIVVKVLPKEIEHYTIWDLNPNLEEFGEVWENTTREYLNNPKFIKGGKTEVSNLEAFWFDTTSADPDTYEKTYYTKKGKYLYTITLTCLQNKKVEYNPTWLRFKSKIII